MTSAQHEAERSPDDQPEPSRHQHDRSGPIRSDTGWHELGDRIFRRRFDPCDVTVTAVLGSAGVAVVDTRCSPAEAREVKEQIRGLTRAPIRWVVNTHAHFDHCWGNVEFTAPRLDPPARIWAHSNACAPRLFDRGSPETAAVLELFEAGAPEWIAANAAELELAAPTDPVDWAARIDLGDRGLDLRYFGRGHTDGDLWIGVPDAGVVLAGDLVEQSAPPAYGPDSFPLEWADTLDRALSWIGWIGAGSGSGSGSGTGASASASANSDAYAHTNADTYTDGPHSGAVIVPGHGEPVDVRFVARQRDDVDAIAQEIARLHAAGVPVARAKSEGSWPQEADSLVHAIARGYAELDGTPAA